MKLKKIIIIYNSRVPTEKANGYQTFKTAESLIMNNKKVEIWAPKRFNLEQLKTQDIKAYYNLLYKPKIVKINVIDFLGLIKFENIFTKYSKFISNIILTITFSIGVFVRILFNQDKDTIYFTRDVNIASFLITIYPFIRNKLFIELHNLPSIRFRLNRQIKILKKCAGIITLTKVMRSELIKNNLKQNKILYEPDAVDISQFKIKMGKNDARRILKLPTDIKIFLYIGNFHTLGNEKGIPEILKSINCLKLNEKFIIYIVGGPLERVKKYREIIHKYKIDFEKIVFLGRQEVKTIPIWLRAADILLMPHPNTTFYQKYVSPLKLFEYMCSRNPIIASNLPSIKEILEHKKNSYLVDAGSFESLAKAIEFITRYKKFANQIAEKAFNDVDNFSWFKRGQRISKFITDRIKK